MSSSSVERNPVECLAEEFAQRCRLGERPSLSEYTQNYPHLADEIRDVFPALQILEELKPGPAELSAPFANLAQADARPRLLGEYRLLREIGRGGMGVVYEAVQESLGRHVALKVLPGGALGGPSHLERFKREARAAGRLHHTNIVPVFGTGECDGVHFYAMQFIPGQGLDRVLHDLRQLRQRHLNGSAAWGLCPSVTDRASNNPSPQPPLRFGEGAGGRGCQTVSGLTGVSEGTYYRSVARVGLQVAEALAYAHRQGVLHRDIKPSNLLLDPQGTTWVTDFGLAKADDAEGLTDTGDFVGTLRYMAPERFGGVSLPQGDVYSLGLTLYELLTLQPAFEDSNRVRLVQRVLHEVPPPPRQADPRVPRDLETIILKCLHKEPHDRYATAAALGDDLRRFLADQPIQARRASWRERGWRWCRRNPAIASLTAAVALLLVALSAGSVVVAVHLRAQRDEAVANELRAREAEDRASRYFQLLEEQRTTLPDPGLVTAFRGQVGRTYHFRVRGSPFGTIWGTDVYTDDSVLATAAVHAGALLPDEIAVVKVTILPGQASYLGSTRNGVASDAWGNYEGSFRVEPLDGKRRVVQAPLVRSRSPRALPPEPAADPHGLMSLRGQNGKVLYLEVIGTADGSVWGTEVYTDDSPVETAAVHAGILRVGEKGVVKVTILPGRQTYQGSTRNGVTTLDYMAFGGSYRLEAVSTPGRRRPGD